jgi:hypothetical protein
MSEEIIDSLLERAEEMLKGDNSREIGAEEIIAILKEYKGLQKELKLKDKIVELQADKNKLINYIGVRENKTYEDICKEFEV